MADGAPSATPDPLPYLPQRLQAPDSESGWDRVRQIYRRNEHGEFSEEAEMIAKSTLTGVLVGMVYGGVPAARASREHYIKQSQVEIYRNRMEAVRAAQNAAIRGFIRYGVRWGWRVGAIVTIFNCVHSGLMAYRDKIVVSNFVVSGAVAGGLFRMNFGLHGMIGGSVLGGLLGVPVGALICGLQMLSGQDLLEQKRKERQQLRERQLQEWTENVALMDNVVQEIQEGNQESPEKEMEKINELLQLPRTATPEQ